MRFSVKPLILSLFLLYLYKNMDSDKENNLFFNIVESTKFTKSSSTCIFVNLTEKLKSKLRQIFKKRDHVKIYLYEIQG